MSQVSPELVNCVVVAFVALNNPTTVDDACDTKPLSSVCNWLQEFAVVVPNASESGEPAVPRPVSG